MKNLIFSICFCFSLVSFGQDDYEKGSYTDNNGKRIEGFIKNKKWAFNPTSIEFKSDLSSESTTISSENLQGFFLGNSIVYEKHKVKIDRSSNAISKLNQEREPVLKEENLLLKVLVKNNAILYKYKDPNNDYYFYKENDLMHSLIYKKYLTNDNKVGENNFYKQQLNTQFKCSNGESISGYNVNYNESSLIKFFKKYGDCTDGQKNTFILEKEKEDIFNIKIIGGLYMNSLEVDSNIRRTFDYGSNSGFVPGIELEAIFPKKKWSVFFDARSHSFESDGTIDVFFPLDNETVAVPTQANYSAIDFGLGGRYYIPIFKNSSLYFGLNVAIDFITNTEILFNEGVQSGGITTDFIDNGSSTAVGIGIGANINPVSFEIRYHTPRNLLRAGTSEATYNLIMFTASYQLLKF